MAEPQETPQSSVVPSTLSAYDQRELAFRQELAKQRAAIDAKTARLRALRLAREAEDRLAAAAAPPPVKTRTRKSRRPHI